jgi:hypothetical protein
LAFGVLAIDLNGIQSFDHFQKKQLPQLDDFYNFMLCDYPDERLIELIEFWVPALQV